MQGITNVVVYLDDIHLSSSNKSNRVKLLDQVSDRLEKAGLRAGKEKCEFLTSSVTYLWHKIDGDSLHPLLKTIDIL